MYLPMSVYEHPRVGCRFRRSRSTCRYSSLSRKVKVSPCIDIEKSSQNSYTTPCNGVANHGAPIGDIWGFANHTCRKNKTECVHDLCALRCFLHVFIFAPKPTTHAETKANRMHPWSLRFVVFHVCFYLRTQTVTAVHMHLMNQFF